MQSLGKRLLLLLHPTNQGGEVWKTAGEAGQEQRQKVVFYVLRSGKGGEPRGWSGGLLVRQQRLLPSTSPSLALHCLQLMSVCYTSAALAPRHCPHLCRMGPAMAVGDHIQRALRACIRTDSEGQSGAYRQELGETWCMGRCLMP